MFERAELSVETLKTKLLEGCELRVGMEPDPARDGNRPHYWEMLELPYIAAGSEHFWAMSQARHYLASHEQMKQCFKIPPHLFGYCRPWDLFASHMIGTSSAIVMHKNLYRSFKWKLVERWTPLWDSTKNAANECDAVADALRSFAAMTAVIFFDGFMFCIPVDIPGYHPQSGTCHFKTASMNFPSIFLSTNNMEYIEKLLLKKTRDIPNQNCSQEVSTDVSDTFFYLSTEGTFNSLMYPGTRVYERLIIMGEKELLAPENPRWEDACTFRMGDM